MGNISKSTTTTTSQIAIKVGDRIRVDNHPVLLVHEVTATTVVGRYFDKHKRVKVVNLTFDANGQLS